MAPSSAALTPCPSCRAPMQAQQVAAHDGTTLTLDLCHACHGIWFDTHENQRMAPEGVLGLFRHLHEHREDAQAPLAQRLSCPRCRDPLAEGTDVVRSGRYFTWRCPRRHGRFATFSSFMVEKGFVRQLTELEIIALAERTRIIHCGSCGAPFDLRQDRACPYCRAAPSLLDPQAVEQALDGYDAKARRLAEGPRAPDLAEALITLERDRERARREAQKERWQGNSPGVVDELWLTGISVVWKWLNRRF